MADDFEYAKWKEENYEQLKNTFYKKKYLADNYYGVDLDYDKWLAKNEEYFAEKFEKYMWVECWKVRNAFYYRQCLELQELSDSNIVKCPVCQALFAFNITANVIEHAEKH